MWEGLQGSLTVNEIRVFESQRNISVLADIFPVSVLSKKKKNRNLLLNILSESM